MKINLWNILGKVSAIFLASIPIVFSILLITIPLQEKYSMLDESIRIFYLVGFGFGGILFSLSWINGMRNYIIDLWELRK